MGIQGLLGLLDLYFEDTHIEKVFRNKTIGIDGYAWLHNSLYSIPDDFENTKNYNFLINYFHEKILLLRRFKIAPYIIFDGNYLPMKSKEEKQRNNKRLKSRDEYKSFCENNNKEGARRKLIESIDVTPDMAKFVIDHLIKLRVQYVVAPYEADAQISYLYKKNIIQGAITIDSDMICYEVGHIFYKMNKFGQGRYINIENIYSSKIINEISFNKFDKDMFLYMCIISGCDYLKSLKGVGLKKAYKIVKENKDWEKSVDAVIQFKSKPIKNNNTDIRKESDDDLREQIENYRENFIKALLTFKYQLVYCPIEKKLRYLSDENSKYYDLLCKFEDKSFLGIIPCKNNSNDQDAFVIDKIAKGEYCPFNRKPFTSICGNKNIINMFRTELSYVKKYSSNSNTNNNINKENRDTNKIVEKKLSSDAISNIKFINLIDSCNKKGRHINKEEINLEEDSSASEKVRNNSSKLIPSSIKLEKSKEALDYDLNKSLINIKTSSNNNINNITNITSDTTEKKLFIRILDETSFQVINSNQSYNINSYSDSESNNIKEIDLNEKPIKSFSISNNISNYDTTNKKPNNIFKIKQRINNDKSEFKLSESLIENDDSNIKSGPVSNTINNNAIKENRLESNLNVNEYNLLKEDSCHMNNKLINNYYDDENDKNIPLSKQSTQVTTQPLSKKLLNSLKMNIEKLKSIQSLSNKNTSQSNFNNNNKEDKDNNIKLNQKNVGKKKIKERKHRDTFSSSSSDNFKIEDFCFKERVLNKVKK